MTDTTARAAAERWLADHGYDPSEYTFRRFVTQVWPSVAERHPDAEDAATRDAALVAAARYLAGALTPADAGRTLARARARATAALAAARQVAVMAVADGASEAETARDVGVDRMALRRWLGKR
ncbi:MAG: hypothetical protein CK431_17015 [Mycobacterium sp.]|nr:MAG: hypothetical protein CK431_17015 [Mycobacterium sp.]